MNDLDFTRDQNTAEAGTFSKNHDLIGGDAAINNVPESYIGPCKVVTGNGKVLTVLSNLDEAKSFASAAIIPDVGGYGSVTVETGIGENVEHQTWEDAFF